METTQALQEKTKAFPKIFFLFWKVNFDGTSWWKSNKHQIKNLLWSLPQFFTDRKNILWGIDQAS